jgi:hypothetical protein
MERFSIDESGYTGFDLLNPQQRFQGATAVSITDEDAAQLIKNHFPKLQAPELKYNSLAKRASYRDPLLKLQRDVLSRNKCVTYVCDKRYLLMLLFLDYAVEPFYYARGLDFYKDGQNFALGSILYRLGTTLLGEEGFHGIMTAFQRAVRSKTSKDLDDLVAAVRRTRWEYIPEALGPLAHAAPECLTAIADPELSTDIALVVLQSLVSRMEIMAGGRYRVEHDQSKNLLNYHALLQRLIDHEDQVVFHLTRITSIEFPLKLTEVSQVDSKKNPAVQIADIMIGAAVDAVRSLMGLGKQLAAAQELIDLYAEDQFIFLMPDLDIEKQKEFRRNTQAGEVIDYFAKHFHK